MVANNKLRYSANKMQIKNRKFLITGGASFIGSNTVDALVENKAKVVIIDNFLTGKRENLNPKAKVYKINIIDPKIENIFKKENRNLFIILLSAGCS